MTTASTHGTYTIGGDLPVDRVGFGAMRLPQNGMADTTSRSPATGLAVLRRAVELGVNHIDTADFYRSRDGSVHANDLIRGALSPYPAGLVIATKVGPILGPKGPAQGTAGDIRPMIEQNLLTLGLDQLDLVYLRIGFFEPPHSESLADRYEALATLQQEGLIRHLGLSNIDAAHLTEAQTIAPVTAIQNLFDPTHPDEAAFARRAAQEGIAFVPFGPLGSGRPGARDALYADIAARRGVTASQVAIAHTLSFSENTLAIPGTGSLTHLEENVAARSLVLTPDELDELNQPGPSVAPTGEHHA